MNGGDMGLQLTASFGEYLHPGARLAAPDEALQILDLWIENAFRTNGPGDCLRFCFLLELKTWLEAS